MPNIPPGTDNLPNTGHLHLKTKLQYINIQSITAQSLDIAIQMWGYNQLQSMQTLMNKNYEIHYTTKTTIQKLTEYFNDMGVILLYICDKRTGNKIGISYLKIRKYIINGLISKINEQQVPIYAYHNNNSAKQIKGMLIVDFNCEIDDSKFLDTNQRNQNLLINMANSKESQLRNRLPKIPSIDQQNKMISRKYLVEPHIFQPTADNNNNNIYHQYQLLPQKKQPTLQNINIHTQHNKQQKHPYQDNTKQYQDYLSIAQLQSKYGRNNPRLQKMKLKLDQLNIIDPQQYIKQIHKKQLTYNQSHYALYITNIKAVLPNTQPQITDLQITNLQQLSTTITNQQKPLLKITIKTPQQIQNNPIFMGKLKLHTILNFQTKLYKGRYQIRQNMLEGEPKTIYLKKKQNNKKYIQMEICLKRTAPSQLSEKKYKLTQNNNIEDKYRRNNRIEDQKQYYYCVYIENFGVNDRLYIMVDGRDSFQGNKMIFKSTNNTQNITILTNNNQKHNITINNKTVYKQQNIKLNNKNYKLKLGCATSSQQLLSLMSQHQSKQNKNSQKNNIVIGPQNIQKKYQQQNDVVKINRSMKIRELIRCFKILSVSQNSQCHTLIGKLLENSQGQLSDIHSQQLSNDLKLFQKLLEAANISEPQKISKICYQQLLHSQFTMFWQCFNQYHKWNILYQKCLLVLHKQFIQILQTGTYPLQAQKSLREYPLTHKQIQTVINKLIKKLNNKSNILFGLADYKVVQEIIEKFILANITENINCEVLQIDSQVKQSIIENNNSNNKNKLSLKKFINNILKLLNNRYGTNKIKITELQNLLKFNINIQMQIDLNQYQLSQIYEHHPQKQLLAQVLCSCGVTSVVKQQNDSSIYGLMISCEDIDSSTLYHMETSSQDIQDNNRLFTEPTHKYLTQQNDDVQYNNSNNIIIKRPQAKQRQKRNINQYNINNNINNQNNNNNISNNNINNKQKQTIILKQIKLTTKKPKQLKLTNQQKPQIQKIILNLQQQLPIAIDLYSDQQYMVQLFADDGQCICYGIFIVSGLLRNIVLYSGDCRYQHNNIVGHIRINKLTQQQQQQQQDQIVIQVQQKQQIKYQQQYKQQQYKQQQKQQQLQDIININTKSLNLPNIRIRYQIIKITPQPKIQSTQQIIIQGSNKIIQYPYQNIVGILLNSNQTRDYLWVDIVGVGRQKLIKSQGLQSICVLAPNQSVSCLLQIQLSEYLAQQQQQQQNQLFAKVIILNMYHLQSLKNIYNSNNQQSTQLQLQNKQHQLQLIITSNNHPIYTQLVNIKKHQNPKPLDISTDPNRYLRTLQLNLSTHLLIDSINYTITINKKSGKSRELLGNFSFNYRKHNNRKIGVYENKGYLVDQNGYRLAINAIQINYNDIFSQNQIGRKKLQTLLTIFQARNIIKINKQLSNKKQQSVDTLKKIIRNCYGFTQSEIYILFELQTNNSQIQQYSQFLSIFQNWDIHCLAHSQNDIHLNNYSLKDIFQQYHLFDFRDDGLIPISKAQIVNKIVFIQTPIPLSSMLINSKQSWVRDHHNKQQQGYIDYLLILWNIQRYSTKDNFFTAQQTIYKGFSNTQNNQTLINALNQQPKYIYRPNQKTILIKLLQYKNLKVDGKSATLTFYINGNKFCEPKLRSYSHKFQIGPVIQTQWPLLLQIYNKSYGYSAQLYSQQIVGKCQVNSDVVNILDGEIFLQIITDQQAIKKQLLLKKQYQKNNKNNNDVFDRNDVFDKNKQKDITHIQKNQPKSIIDNSLLLESRRRASELKQSRRDKWHNLKQSKNQFNKIKDLLTKTSQF